MPRPCLRPRLIHRLNTAADAIRDINMHQEFNRQKTIFILRGLPGSGRSSKARALKKASGDGGVVICAADYFRKRSGSRYKYDFNPREFHKAHMLARKRALHALEDGMDPVIINNPNMLLWHMYPYVLMAFNRGYWVVFVDMPDTWDLSLEELYRKSGGCVPLEVMEKMKNSYQKAEHINDILENDQCMKRWDKTREKIKNGW